MDSCAYLSPSVIPEGGEFRNINEAQNLTLESLTVIKIEIRLIKHKIKFKYIEIETADIRYLIKEIIWNPKEEWW